jgi:hypothetical protein
MKRNIIETLVAFVGLGMVYYGAALDQCLHATGQPAPNCHFTPLGDTFFLVGFVVGWIGIAPWKFYARNYLCQICGVEFGGGREGKVSQASHLQISHPDFYKWDVRWSRWTGIFVIFCFVYVIGAGELVGALPSLSAFTDWWILGFVGVAAILVFDLTDLHFVTKKFRNKWLLLHPEGKTSEGVRVEQEKLSAGVNAWNQLTRGKEQYFGGLMAGGLKKKGNFAGGYGIYFTSQRIIGVKTSRWFVLMLVLAALAGIGGVSALGIIVGISPAYAPLIGIPIIGALIVWGQRRLRFQDPMTIEELERRKDFEIRRDNISGIDLKKPGLVRRGHLIVTTKSGEAKTLMITQEAGVFDRLRGLVSGFCNVPTSSPIEGQRLTTSYPSPSYADREHLDDSQDPSDYPNRLYEERHVEKRDFEWCPHCAAMFPRGTSVCPACGKSISS